MDKEAKKIKQLREAAGLSQAKFGVILGIPKSTIEKWEYGHNPPAYISNLIEHYLLTEGYITSEEQTYENT